MHESNLICPFMNIAPRMMEFVASPKSESEEIMLTNGPMKDEQKKNDTNSGGLSMGMQQLAINLNLINNLSYLLFRIHILDNMLDLGIRSILPSH